MAATTSANSSNLALSGLASGLDWTSIVSELLTVESAPVTQMQSELTADQNKSAGFSTIGTDLTTLTEDVNTLSDASFFDSKTTSSSNSSVASATAGTNTPLGTYSFTVNSLATDAVQVGAKAGAALNSSSDVSSLTLSSAGFATPVTAGTFTVNGQTVTVATSDTLQDVFNNISTATGGTVTGSYNSTSDEITLSSSGSSPIVLGSATDTSNFLQSAELYNNGTNSVTSAAALGGVNLSDTLNDANFSTAVTDGGSGAGAFTINGVTINYNASTDTASSVLERINSSAAGVTATYDSVGNYFVLTNNTTGDVGISMQDVTGNFLAASGISGGTLQRGSNLQYSINNGSTLTSESNTVNGSTSGVAGLSITALAKGTTNISVATDTTTIASTITSFVNDYNAIQNYVSNEITPTTNSSTGAVTPGMFTGNLDVENIAIQLRQIVDASPEAAAGVQNLNDLGVTSNGNDNTLSFSDTTSLTSALTTNLSAVKDLFTNATTGIASTLQTYLNNTTSLTGVLSSDEGAMTTEETSLSDSITTLQQKISNDQTRLDQEFTDMETAINTDNQEKNYLNDYFSSSSASTAPAAAGSGASSASTSSSSSSSTSTSG